MTKEMILQRNLSKSKKKEKDFFFLEISRQKIFNKIKKKKILWEKILIFLFLSWVRKKKSDSTNSGKIGTLESPEHNSHGEH